MVLSATQPAEVPSVELVGVEKRFGSNRVLRGIDLQVLPGRVFTILGGSGSGKSVMLKHMIGLLRPDAGQVFFEGQDVTRLSERQWVQVRRGFGYVFQGAALFDSLNVHDNVAYPLREHLKMSREELAARVARCLDAVGLPGIEGRMPAELSGGMRKRIGLARAIALEPRVILYDEPTTGLDPANSRRIGRLIRDLQQRLSVTSVVVTHDLELCFEISDRVSLLVEGRVAFSGTVDEFRHSKLAQVRDFVDGDGDEA